MAHVFSSIKKMSLKSFFVLKYVSEILLGSRHVMIIIQRCKANRNSFFYFFAERTRKLYRNFNTVLLVKSMHGGADISFPSYYSF